MPGQNATILIVDDDITSAKLLESLLKVKFYDTRIAASGEEALQSVAQQPPDLILLDIMMPGMDGFEVAARLKAEARTKAIPVIMVTALDDRDSRLRALEMGAEEFLSKPVDRAELWVRVRNLLRLKEYGDFLANYNHILELEVRDRTRALYDSYHETIYTITRAAEYKDVDTGRHLQRVSYYTSELAQQLGLDAEFTDILFYASPMHDVGKIGIPDHVLLNPSPLTQEEWVLIRGHCDLGAKILFQGNSPYLKVGAEIALSHHERWDGSGYPNGLKGEQIPLSGRIMTICDIYDALRSKRPYKPSFDHDKAMQIITEGDHRTRPEHFDPGLLATFKRCAGRFRDIYQAHEY